MRTKLIERKIVELNLTYKMFVNLLKKKLKGLRDFEIEYVFNAISFYLNSDDKQLIKEYCNSKIVRKI